MKHFRKFREARIPANMVVYVKSRKTQPHVGTFVNRIEGRDKDIDCLSGRKVVFWPCGADTGQPGQAVLRAG